ncbi:MAG: hypothetical protein OES09_07190 [Gammaproteobacteria bacterium]|nr:hypothetical protein [Gammaproteobacteria bacterium]
MEILKNLVNEHGSSLMSALTESGFTADQAQQFLPEAAQGMSDAISGGGISELLSGSDEGGMASTIMSKIDIESIASKVGIDSSLASNGLTALIPKILAMLNTEGGGLSSLLGGGGGGGIGGVAGMAGKMFNK